MEPTDEFDEYLVPHPDTPPRLFQECLQRMLGKDSMFVQEWDLTNGHLRLLTRHYYRKCKLVEMRLVSDGDAAQRWSHLKFLDHRLDTMHGALGEEEFNKTVVDLRAECLAWRDAFVSAVGPVGPCEVCGAPMDPYTYRIEPYPCCPDCFRAWLKMPTDGTPCPGVA